MSKKIVTKSNLIIFAAFLIPAVILTCVYGALGFYPFGDKSVLIMDMSDQYNSFFASLRYLGDGDNTLFFSWSRSMGGNFVGLFAYYIASPLSFITVFFSLENLPIALLLLTILKTGLCGLTFALFLEHAWNERKGKPAVLLFSTCYALMSYVVVYGMCLMWLDGLILLPLVLLGIEKLIQGKKGIVYMLSLAAIFICNYYTSYMIGLFSALYIVYRVCCVFDKEKWKQALCVCAKFAANTFLAFGIAAPLLLATVKDVMTGKFADGSNNIAAAEYNFSIWQFVKRVFGGIYGGITNSGLPPVFCGTVILVLVVLFFFMKKINWKEKVGAGAIFLLLIVSMWYGPLDKVWHCFQYPNWFPYRYAFLFSAFMIMVAYRAFTQFKFSEVTKSRLKLPLVIYLVSMVLLFQIVELYNNAKENIVGLDNQFGYKTITAYREFLDKLEQPVADIKKQDESFYRMEKDVGTEFSKNDAMTLGYNGMTHYSSTYHAGVNAFTSKLGIAQAHIWNSGYGSGPVTDSIFDVKYRIMTQELPDSYKEIAWTKDVTTYENTTVLPIAFAAGKMDKISFASENNFENQNKLVNGLAQTDSEYFTPVAYTVDEGSLEWDYTLDTMSDNPVYMRIEGSNIGWGTIFVNGKEVANHFSSETNCNAYLGQFSKGDSVEVNCYSDDVLRNDEWIYELDLDEWNEAYKKLAKGGLKITEQSGSTIEGTITVGNNQMIFTSIPYDEGYTVELDGKEVEKTALKMDGDNGKELNVFLTIQAQPGEHTLRISYMPPGITTGFILTIAAVVVAFVYYKWDWINSKVKGKEVA